MTQLNFSNSDFSNQALLTIEHAKKTDQLYNLMFEDSINNKQNKHSNPLCKHGHKVFSQTDEDGITLEIIKRLEIEKGFFAEFGVGNGSENNTLSLLGIDWSGFWCGGEELLFSTESSKRLFYSKAWISLENILELYNTGLQKLNIQGLDLISLDLDGNDFYLIEELLSNDIKPSLFIVEYNAKFKPPIEFKIKYNSNHRWDGSDYYGASLYTYNKLFDKHGYSLICCNAATGSNAFFIKKEYLSLFPEVPKDINKIYTPPSFHLYKTYGHKISTQSILSMIND